ncbi:helix-turn-helix domain-containing protein [Arthrobacter sp. PsM3]|uniref:helix-turn-helix domain-containing protein n=1 Tax=Arthrobacter sp. PsM3 TaxID=3030531 RepID=UPI00263A5B3D|nr:TetR/AcrR family transcriptional regulator [Arthrobacter sp. PsM3]MDN4643180.1 TetR/AcrR family transcriptional regulator [Arthrobacter sp. PsM3]
MAPPPTLPRQRLRYTRILDVAAGFARKGLDSVVLSEVAAKADVPLGTLYRYFPSATQLVLALYRKQLTELHAANAPAAPGANAAAGAPAGAPVDVAPGAAPGALAGTAGRPAKKSAGRAAGRSSTPPAANTKGDIPAQALAGVVMEIFHMRLMQPAVEQCLNKAVYSKDTDTTKLLREIDSAAEKAVTAVSGDAAISRVLLLTVTGLVQSVRCRRLSLFEAEEDLKKACFLLTCSRRAA